MVCTVVNTVAITFIIVAILAPGAVEARALTSDREPTGRFLANYVKVPIIFIIGDGGVSKAKANSVKRSAAPSTLTVKGAAIDQVEGKLLCPTPALLLDRNLGSNIDCIHPSCLHDDGNSCLQLAAIHLEIHGNGNPKRGTIGRLYV